LEHCNFVILPQQLEQFGTFDMKRADAIFDIGYREALEAMPEIISGMREAGWEMSILKE
jgi:hypothetical protein